MIAKSKEVIEELGKDLLDVVTEIDKVRDQLYNGKQWTPASGEIMSQAIVKLSALNAYLGEWVATAKYDAAQMEATYKVSREAIKLESMNERKTTASEAESTKIVETSSLLESYNKADYQFNLLKNKREDTSEFIEALKTRLIHMQVQQKESRNAT